VPDKEWMPDERTAASAAYQKCSIRIIRQSEDWQTTIPPFLVGQIENEWPPAAIVFLELMDELDAGQQVAGIVAILELVDRTGPSQLGTSINTLTGWLQQKPNRTAILQIADQRTAGGFENLVVGLLRSGEADKAVIAKLTTRFEEESINRQQILGKLIEACGDQPYLPQIVIDLIKHPALNAPASVMVKDGKFKQVSLRADKYLPFFKQLPAEHRIKFRSYMKELVESGKDGESEAAQQILRAW
jgi:hypothetical protein